MLQGEHEDRAKHGDGVKHGGIDIGVQDFHGVLLEGEAMMRGLLAQGVSQQKQLQRIVAKILTRTL
jgi:hypothetical protein